MDAPRGPLGSRRGSLICLAMQSIIYESEHGDWAFPMPGALPAVGGAWSPRPDGGSGESGDLTVEGWGTLSVNAG